MSTYHQVDEPVEGSFSLTADFKPCDTDEENQNPTTLIHGGAGRYILIRFEDGDWSDAEQTTKDLKGIHIEGTGFSHSNAVGALHEISHMLDEAEPDARGEES